MKRFSVIFMILLVGAGVMFNSCIEDTLVDCISENSEILRFGISSETVYTRAAVDAAEEDIVEQADSVSWSLMEVEGDEDFSQPLYVTMVSEKREVVPDDEYASEDVMTRGKPVTTSTFASMYGERGFGLFAYLYENIEGETSTKSEYIHNQPVKYMSSYWGLAGTNSTEQYYWPGANYKVRFYAYAPYAGGYYDDIIKVQSEAYGDNNPTLDIVVESTNRPATDKDMTSHPDLVIAKTGEVPGNKNAEQPLKFFHAMSAVTFKIGAIFVEDAVKITKIEFRNVLRSGTINLETQEWENIDTQNPTKITLIKDIPISGEGGQLGSLTEDDYFMMLPQMVPSNAELAVTFVLSSDGTTERTLVSNIGGYEWKMGELYTYTLTAEQMPTDEYTFTVTAPSETSADYLGDVSTTGNVTSYLTHTNVFGIETKEAVKWTTEYSTDDGVTWTTTRPEFFSSFTAGANGKAEGTDEYKGIIAPITPYDEKNPFLDIPEEERVSNEIINLYEFYDENTANCYVVNKAGTYTFPLVYGNAIKGGIYNKQAYNPGGSGANTTDYYPKFVNHIDNNNNNKISSPFIPLESRDSAKLLWTDAPNLIKDVELSTETMSVAGTDVHYITFTVPREHLAPGNAVIALRNSNGIVKWSWHIWVTTWNGTSVTVTSSGEDFDFSDTILGYCPAKDAQWFARSVKVRFRQEGSGMLSSTYSFSQDDFDIQYSEGNMPYYQWGRKDPLLMYNYITDSNGIATSGLEKICFGPEKHHYTLKVYNGSTYINKEYDVYFEIVDKLGTERASGVSMSESIKNPCTFYARRPATGSIIGEFDWCQHIGYNRWDATNTNYITSVSSELATVKTIYDPCPPGWCVPPVGAFYGLTSAGQATAYSPSKTTMSQNDITPAFQVQANGGNIVKLPITGDRNRYTGAPWYNSLGIRNVELWTATPTTGTKAYYVSTGNSYFAGLENGGLAKSSGFAVLPVKESE